VENIDGELHCVQKVRWSRRPRVVGSGWPGGLGEHC